MTLATSLRIAMLGLALLGGSASAQHPPGSVEVKGMKNPDMRSFRHVTAGLDTFDEYHAMAPAVGALRFKVRAKSSNKDKSIEGITLNIVGTEATIPVPIEADGGFVIARNEQAYDDNADLMFNRKRNLFESLADIRTPGVPANARRLGDLRLECKVNISIIKKEVPFYIRAMVNTFLVTTDWCSKLPIFFSLPPAKRIAKATLVHHERRREVTKVEFDNGFESPLVDPSWPDDTLLELELVPEEATPDAPAPQA
jgi:hypothetical protein